MPDWQIKVFISYYDCFISSAKKVTAMFHPAFACFSVRLLATSLKNYLSWKVCLWTRKKWLNFVSHHHLDPDTEMFWRILQHCKIGIHTVALENWSDVRDNFTSDVSLDKEVPIKIWKSSVSGSPDSESTLWIWYRSVLAQSSERYLTHTHRTMQHCRVYCSADWV